MPFEFDLLFGQGEEQGRRRGGRAGLPDLPHAHAQPRRLRLSRFSARPAPFTRELHVARDRTLVAEIGVDGVYYDISVNNVRHICLADAHGHAPGDAAAITAAYRTLLAETAAAMRAAAGGRTIPQGTEMINEQMHPVYLVLPGTRRGQPGGAVRGRAVPRLDQGRPRREDPALRLRLPRVRAAAPGRLGQAEPRAGRLRLLRAGRACSCRAA